MTATAAAAAAAAAAATGELPLPVVHLLADMRLIDLDEFGNVPHDYDMAEIRMGDAGPGFTLPADIGDLDPAINELDLKYLGLTGGRNRDAC